MEYNQNQLLFVLLPIKGCVQEEIKFASCPELLTACIICSKMKRNEAIFMKGAKQYSLMKGYGGSLKFDRDFVQDPEVYG